MASMFRLNERSFILCFIFYCLPFFDMMTGFLVVKGTIAEGSLASPSQVGRAVAGILLLYAASKNRMGTSWLFILLWMIIVELQAGLGFGPSFGVIFGFATVYKLTYFWLLFTVLAYYAKQNIHDLGKFLKYNLIFISCSIIFSAITGVGNPTYGWGFGTKGFFASGNGLGLYLGIGGLILLLLQHYRMYLNVSLTTYILIILGTLLIGSKTALLLSFLLLVGRLWLSSRRVLSFLFVGGLLIWFSPQILHISMLMFDVIVLRYQNSDSILEYLASSRIDYISNAFEIYYSKDIDLIRWFIGAGSYVSFQDPNAVLQYDTLESDVFDIFFMYGLAGVVAYCLVFAYGAIILKQHIYFLLTWGLLFMHSLFAGHVIFNGMSITILAFLLAIGVSIRQGRKNRVPYSRAKSGSTKNDAFILASMK